MSLYRSLEHGERHAVPQARAQGPHHCPVRRPAGAREHGPARHPGAALRVRHRARRALLAARLPRPADRGAWSSTSTRSASPSRRRSPGCGTARPRTTASISWCCTAWTGARSRCCAPTASICCRSAFRSARPTWSRRSPAIRSWRARRRGCSRPSSIRTRRRTARPASPSSRRRSAPAWTPSPTSTRTASCRRYMRLVLATLRTNYYQRGAGRRAVQAVPVAQDRSGGGAGDAAAAAGVRDLRVRPAHRGRAPARRQGRARRHPLVGPARGLPHRGARPDEGADGQELRHRAGRGQGRLRGQAAAARRRPRGAPGRGGRVLQDPDPRHAGPDRQPRRRSHRAARARGPLRRRRSLSGGRRRQGHRHLLRHRERDQPGVRPLAGRRLRLGRLRRLRPQGHGHHRPRRLGVGQAPLPGAGQGLPDRAVHRDRHRRHVGRRVRQRHAAVRADQADRGVRPPPHLRSTPTPIRRSATPSGRACSRCRAPAGTTTTAAS